MPIAERLELGSSETPSEVSIPREPGLLPGSVCVQYVRCGKEGCACRAGKLHGPYHYRVWRSGGSVRKAYVKPEDVAAVTAACEAYTDCTRALRALRHERERLIHALEKDMKTAKKVLALYRSPRINR